MEDGDVIYLIRPSPIKTKKSFLTRGNSARIPSKSSRSSRRDFKKEISSDSKSTPATNQDEKKSTQSNLPTLEQLNSQQQQSFQTETNPRDEINQQMALNLLRINSPGSSSSSRISSPSGSSYKRIKNNNRQCPQSISEALIEGEERLIVESSVDVKSPFKSLTRFSRRSLKAPSSPTASKGSVKESVSMTSMKSYNSFTNSPSSGINKCNSNSSIHSMAANQSGNVRTKTTSGDGRMMSTLMSNFMEHSSTRSNPSSRRSSSSKINKSQNNDQTDCIKSDQNDRAGGSASDDEDDSSTELINQQPIKSKNYSKSYSTKYRPHKNQSQQKESVTAPPVIFRIDDSTDEMERMSY